MEVSCELHAPAALPRYLLTGLKWGLARVDSICILLEPFLITKLFTLPQHVTIILSNNTWRNEFLNLYSNNFLL
jgi:hypothetical protein